MCDQGRDIVLFKSIVLERLELLRTMTANMSSLTSDMRRRRLITSCFTITSLSSYTPMSLGTIGAGSSPRAFLTQWISAR